MTKLGIDIVDLSDPQIQRRNERTLQLVLCNEDITLEHPNLYWLLWSAKEAVFKCHREALNFSPKQIPIALSEIDGDISFTSEGITGKLDVTDSYIAAICSDQLGNIAYEVFRTDKPSDGTLVRDYVLDFFQHKDPAITLEADELNLPILEPGSFPLSISHHYHWSAFAYPREVN